MDLVLKKKVFWPLVYQCLTSKLCHPESQNSINRKLSQNYSKIKVQNDWKVLYLLFFPFKFNVSF